MEKATKRNEKGGLLCQETESQRLARKRLTGDKRVTASGDDDESLQDLSACREGEEKKKKTESESVAGSCRGSKLKSSKSSVCVCVCVLEIWGQVHRDPLLLLSSLLVLSWFSFLSISPWE